MVMGGCDRANLRVPLNNKRAGEILIKLKSVPKASSENDTRKTNKERLFHFIKQARKGDAFLDMLNILEHGFIGYGSMGYANAVLFREESRHFRTMDAIAVPSRQQITKYDRYGIEMEVDKSQSQPAEDPKTMRALKYVPASSVTAIYIYL